MQAPRVVQSLLGGWFLCTVVWIQGGEHASITFGLCPDLFDLSENQSCDTRMSVCILSRWLAPLGGVGVGRFGFRGGVSTHALTPITDSAKHIVISHVS